jgi:hypothetical protein
MYGMAQAVGDLIEQGAPAFEAAVPMLSQLLKAEMAEREVRSIAYQIKAARFPAYKDLAGFDFAAGEINEALVRQLHRGDFMDSADNVVLIGGPGTGKSHIATALGIQAVEHHRRKVRFFATVDLVNALEQEKAANKAGQLAERLLKLDLIILDELGYLPFTIRRPCCSICSAALRRTRRDQHQRRSFCEWATSSAMPRCTTALLSQDSHCHILKPAISFASGPVPQRPKPWDGFSRFPIISGRHARAGSVLNENPGSSLSANQHRWRSTRAG